MSDIREEYDFRVSACLTLERYSRYKHLNEHACKTIEFNINLILITFSSFFRF